MLAISPEENIGAAADTPLTTGIYGAGMILENFLHLMYISKENMDSKVSHGCSLSVDSFPESSAQNGDLLGARGPGSRFLKFGPFRS